jgi:hypothetical protein
VSEAFAFQPRHSPFRASCIPSKYIVLTQINENLGQGGRSVFYLPLFGELHQTPLYRADMACHWEDSDTVIQELFSNVCHFSVYRRKLSADDLVLSGLSDMYMHRVCDTEHLTSFTDATHTMNKYIHCWRSPINE